MAEFVLTHAIAFVLGIAVTKTLFRDKVGDLVDKVKDKF